MAIHIRIKISSTRTPSGTLRHLEIF